MEDLVARLRWLALKDPALRLYRAFLLEVVAELERLRKDGGERMLKIEQPQEARTDPLCALCGQPERHHPTATAFHTFQPKPAPSEEPVPAEKEHPDGLKTDP